MESPCRCAKRCVLSAATKRPPTQSERYSSQKPTSPSASEPRVGRHHPEEEAEVLRDEYLVDQDLVHPDSRRLYRRPQGGEEEYQGDESAVGAREGPETPEDLAHRHRRRRCHEPVVLLDAREEPANLLLQLSQTNPHPSIPFRAFSASTSSLTEKRPRRLAGLPQDPIAPGARSDGDGDDGAYGARFSTPPSPKSWPG